MSAPNYNGENLAGNMMLILCGNTSTGYIVLISEYEHKGKGVTMREKKMEPQTKEQSNNGLNVKTKGNPVSIPSF